MVRKFVSLSALLLAALTSVVVLGGPSASAAGTAQSTVPSAVPFSSTPNIVDGTDASGNSYRVFDMAQVGDWIVVGGIFTQVANVPPNGTTVYPRPNLFAFNRLTGAVSTTFAPNVNGPVNAVAAGPGNTVLVGGKFSQVNGVNSRNFAVLDINTGAKVATTPVFNGAVQDIALLGNRVFVGGTFTAVGGAAHGGLATLDATRWTVDPYLSLDVSGHHNYGVNGTGAQAPVGVSALDITSDGSQMVIIGNFTSVEGNYRDQVAKVLLPSTGAVVDPNWATSGYHAPCTVSAFDSYIRSVQWSPDGTYFVITATGGPHANTLCDTAARWNASDTGSAVNPAWVASTGGDSLWSVAVTGTAIYVGGHERWLNNALGSDKAAPGAVPRPGMAALDPYSGVPLSWNPARNPRGIGAQAMLATADGLYVGSDTDYIGNFQYRHQKIAFFPLAGGTAPASQNTGSLPGNVELAGRKTATQTAGVDAVVTRPYDGTTAGTDSTLASNGGISWSKSRGAFMAGNKLFYGYPDSTGSYELAWQTFDGTTFGPQTILSAPYHDPTWMNVQTGSGQTYDGAFPNFYGTELGNVTGMFYSNGRLYYTKMATSTSGSPSLFSRAFSTDSGIVGPTSTVVASSGFTNSGGMFLNGNTLYMADRTNGNLLTMSFANGVPSGSATVVSGPTTDGKDWRTQSLFLGPTPAVNHPPTAVISSSSCSGLTCTFSGSGSSDPDGNPLTYSWDFGDATAAGSGVTVQHTYAQAGSYTVTLTVSDGQGGTNSTTTSVTVAPLVGGVGVRGATGVSAAATTTSMSLPYPAGIQAGDGLVLVLSTYSATTANSTPGFTPVGSQTAMSSSTVVMTTQVLQRVADGTESGNLAVTFPAGVKATAQMVAYSGTPSTGPVRLLQGGNACATTTSCTTPTVSTGIVANDWVMSVWSDKSANGGTWTPPGSVTVRDNRTGTGAGGVIATVVADSGGPLAGGSYGNLTATLSSPETKAIMLTIVIAGS